MLDKIQDKIKAYEAHIEQSAAQHNALIGGLRELKALYEEMKKDEPVVEPVIEPVIEAVPE